MRTSSILFCLFLAACASETAVQKRRISEDRQKVRAELQSEISLKADRSNLDNLRKDIPQEKKEENDELAFDLQLKDLKEEPSRLRERFQDLVTKKRQRFNEKVDRLRKEYDKDAVARRDKFNTEQSDRRVSFNRSKHTSDEMHKFYEKLDQARLDFYSAERDRRSDFDDEIHQQTKDFNDYMHERTTQFNESWSLYNRRYQDAKKNHPKPQDPQPSDMTP